MPNNLPAEPTSRERASKWVYAVHKWRGMSPAFMQTQVSRLEAQFDAVAKAAKLEALEKAAEHCESRAGLPTTGAHRILIKVADEIRKLKGEA